MKVLPDNRNMAAEERAYLDVCHRTKSSRLDVEAILEAESFFDASLRPTHDAWGEIYDSIWIGTHREITGSSIMSALRDHLAAIQDTKCCYCFLPLLKGGYSRQIEHVLPKSVYGRFSFHFWNLAVACERCNRIKKKSGCQAIPHSAVDYPEASAFTDQFHPRVHQYAAHIDFVSSGTPSGQFIAYVGCSAQGKKLYDDVLKAASEEMNREWSDPVMNASYSKLRTAIASQDATAAQVIVEFQDMLRDYVVMTAS